jgi:hypothetical protein
MSRNRRQRRAEEGGLDESAGLAGWLYTDLLLGLVVVFMGGLAFLVPSVLADSDADADADAEGAVTATTTIPTTTTSTVPPTTVPEVPLCGGIVGEDQHISVNLRANQTGSDLLNDANRQIEALLEAKGIDTSSKIGFALAYGGDLTFGKDDAFRLTERLAALDPERFGTMGFRAIANRSRPRGEVRIDMFASTLIPC